MNKECNSLKGGKVQGLGYIVASEGVLFGKT